MIEQKQKASIGCEKDGLLQAAVGIPKEERRKGIGAEERLKNSL